MRIIGFLQVKDEVETGNLSRYLSENAPLFDVLFAVDDGSTDETVEVLERFGARVVKLEKRNFQNESENKALLLRRVLEEAVDGDAILWLDADEVLYASREELQELIERKFELGFDSISFEHLNLWRSEHHYRTDDGYFGLRPVRIWRASPDLTFSGKPGLHGQTHPAGLRATYHSKDYPVMHYGFSSLDAILSKYSRYHLDWQSGYPLDRLVTEAGRVLVNVADYDGKLGARFGEVATRAVDEPPLIFELDWRLLARRARLQAENEVSPLITVVCPIFKSIEWLEFAYGETLKLRKEFRRGEVEILFVANDATPEVIGFLSRNFIPFIQASGKSEPGEWYINSVYRAYNEGALAATTPLVFLINSDMAFAQGALRRLYQSHTSKQLSISRLIERGRLPSGPTAVERDLGSHPSNFRRADFQSMARKLSSNQILRGGLFMPLLCSKEVFKEFGGFPEGNIPSLELESYLDGAVHRYALPGEDLVPGDAAFFRKLEASGYSHTTVSDSICYHFQEGELKSRRDSRRPSGLAIKNDLMRGINGEEVLWTRAAKRFELEESFGTISTGLPGSRLQAATTAFRLYLKAAAQQRKHRYRVVFSNATYQLPQRLGLRTISLIQDSPTRPSTKLLQRLATYRSDFIVTNDLNLWSSQLRRVSFWFNVEIPEEFFASRSKRGIEIRRPGPSRGLFVGALNATKGISTLKTLILAFPEVNWTVISKYRESKPNWLRTSRDRFLTALSHHEVLREIERSDFLIAVSPWETQHLASIEAVANGKPVFITQTGLLGYQREGMQPFGWVTAGEVNSDFQEFLKALPDFQPHSWFEQYDWAGERDLFNWIMEVVQDSFERPKKLNKAVVFVGRLRSFAANQARLIMRSVVVPVTLNILRRK